MQISGLSASNTFSATDVLAIEINVNGVEKTYKLTGATLAAALASIGSYLKTTDVVNNLTSTSTTAPLSAAQGKALNDQIKNLYAVERHTLGTAQSYNANTNFEVIISIGKTGYTAVSISGWNLNNRDGMNVVHISGMIFNNNKTEVLLYGRVTDQYQFSASAYVDVLYLKNA